MWFCLEFCSCGALRLGTMQYVYSFFVGLGYVVEQYFNDSNSLLRQMLYQTHFRNISTGKVCPCHNL